MKYFSATDAKNKFGELLEQSATEPVVIRKNGRDVAVLLSKAEFDNRDSRLVKKQLVQQYHDESMVEFDELYKELAK